MKASEIFQRVHTIVQDIGGVRWPFAELCMWLNDGQKEIVLQKPSASSRTVKIPLQSGTLQAIPAEYIMLLRVVRNSAGRPVTVVARDLMDAQAPDWHQSRERSDAKHAIIDEADPKSFYVYPANDGTGELEVIMSAVPAVIVATGDPALLESYDMETSINSIYDNALVDYVVYRSHSKDMQNAGAAQRAALHYQQFANSLGMKVTLDANMNPNAKARVAAAAGGVA
ncbi:DUF6682 family protein [Agrobacterium tumefaciens]|uniref:phage adaptor protein n=1 Tax=Agrobacterium tumefaciens TaxID=358 RepID=UPI001573BBEE|nr:hypothetical protein [Agrobacterium tumefaciens]